MPGERLSSPTMVKPWPVAPICSAVVLLVTRTVPSVAAGLLGGWIVVAARPLRDSTMTFLLISTDSM